MEISILLAKFWGWYLLVFFLVLSLRPARIRQIFLDIKDQKFALVTSLLATVIGLINILMHNEWEANWKIFITLLGWSAFILGILLFLIPEKVAVWFLKLNIKLVQILYMLLFILGIFLLNVGYQLVLY